MGKKSTSGRAYAIPNRKPTRVFTNGSVVIKVFYSIYQAEVFQTADNHTQRMTMKHNDYENFENRLFSNGFKLSVV